MAFASIQFVTAQTPTTLASGVLASDGTHVKAAALSGLTWDGTTLTATGGGGGVTTFNTRSGAVSLTLADVTTALAADLIITLNGIAAVAATSGQAGNPLTLSGSAAAVGSGLAGGNVALTPGAGDGAGANGQVLIPTGTTAVPGLSIGTSHGVGLNANGNGMTIVGSNQNCFYIDIGNGRIQQQAAGQFGWSSNSTNAQVAQDTGLARQAAGIVAATNGSSGVGGFSGIIYPAQYPTASAPAYVKGAIYFDTTLNKLRVGGATAWETVTSS